MPENKGRFGWNYDCELRLEFFDSTRTTNPLPADAAIIPAAARGTFHPPPAAEAPVLYPRIAPEEFRKQRNREGNLAICGAVDHALANK